MDGGGKTVSPNKEETRPFSNLPSTSVQMYSQQRRQGMEGYYNWMEWDSLQKDRMGWIEAVVYDSNNDNNKLIMNP